MLCLQMLSMEGSKLAVLKFAEEEITYCFVFVKDENFQSCSKFTTARSEAGAPLSRDGAVMRKVR